MSNLDLVKLVLIATLIASDKIAYGDIVVGQTDGTNESPSDPEPGNNGSATIKESGYSSSSSSPVSIYTRASYFQDLYAAGGNITDPYQQEAEVLTEPQNISFIECFDQILKTVSVYQVTITPIMQKLVEDASGGSGVQVCILSRTRITLTKASRDFLNSFSHWANLGTSMEGPHCQHDAKTALEELFKKTSFVAKDLVRLSYDYNLNPKAIFAFEKIERSTRTALIKLGTHY